MPRAVDPWIWRRALRDHGPDDGGVLLTLYTIATFMDRDGSCWPSQETIAKGARCTSRTVRRHVEEARALGWLHCETHHRGRSRGWRCTVYTASVPDHVELSETEEEINEVAIGDVEFGDAPDTGVRTNASYLHGADTGVRTMGPEAVRADIRAVGADTERDGADIRSNRADTGDTSCGHGCPTKSSINSSSKSSSKKSSEGRFAPRAQNAIETKDEKTEDEDAADDAAAAQAAQRRIAGMMADRQAQPQTPEQQIDWWAQVVEHVAKASRVAQSRDPERIRVLCRGRFDLTTHQVRRALKDAGDRAEPGVKYDPETGQPYI